MIRRLLPWMLDFLAGIASIAGALWCLWRIA
jgi:hypothetical protein